MHLKKRVIIVLVSPCLIKHYDNAEIPYMYKPKKKNIRLTNQPEEPNYNERVIYQSLLFFIVDCRLLKVSRKGKQCREEFHRYLHSCIDNCVFAFCNWATK